jgi:hypothetical protein
MQRPQAVPRAFCIRQNAMTQRLGPLARTGRERYVEGSGLKPTANSGTVATRRKRVARHFFDTAIRLQSAFEIAIKSSLRGPQTEVWGAGHVAEEGCQMAVQRFAVGAGNDGARPSRPIRGGAVWGNTTRHLITRRRFRRTGGNVRRNGLRSGVLCASGG